MRSLHTVLISTVLLLGVTGDSAAQALTALDRQIPLPEGVGTPSVFLKNFEIFKSNQAGSKDPDSLTIPLGFVGGHSRSFIGSAGSLTLNLRTGSFAILLTNVVSGTTYNVWLIDEGASDDTVDDRPFLLASLPATSGGARIEGQLNDKVLEFTIDNVVVTTEAKSPDKVLASGSMNVLQKVFFGTVSLTNQNRRVADGALATRPLPFASLVPDIAQATSPEPLATPAVVPIDKLIQQGSKLFIEGTFRGNGRTCATCHPAHNNFTIDPAFISTLPLSDPLFVAENNRLLSKLEKPALMRAFGLILENVDGLEAPTTKFVMRSVPHALGMTVSLASPPFVPDIPAEMTGWSGDGAPGAGSLRDFATGAVTQHFTKTLERIPGRDFVLPTQRQLDAMEAFQLSLGRAADFDLQKLLFQDADVEAGKQIFLNGTGNPDASANCNVCHSNGGALIATGLNLNLNTNVEDRANPARIIEDFPIDGGFGKTLNADGSFGDRSFNITSVVEAADTPPFFHNNIVGTLEAAVAFYAGPEFNTPRPPGARFAFTQAQINQVSNFLRGINTLQNIDVARRELAEIPTGTLIISNEAEARLATAYNETGDVVRVLSQTNIFPSAMVQVISARQLIIQAQQSRANSTRRRQLIQSAITTLDGARRLVALP